jgi:glycosyltransferase involved in cell wall biosynthesis
MIELELKPDNDSRPLITYITVVRNMADTILRCMESVWNQSYDNIEYIIIDGGSDDGTVEIINSHIDKIDYFISQPDSGIYNAMNKGLRLAKGRLICFMNADDYALPDAAQTAVNLYKKTGAMLIAGQRFLEPKGGQPFPDREYPMFLFKNGALKHNRIWHQSLFAHRDAFNIVGYLPEEYPIIADFVWTARCVDAGLPVCLTNEKLCCYFLGGGSADNEELSRVMIKFAGDTFPFLSEKDVKRVHHYLRFPKFFYGFFPYFIGCALFVKYRREPEFINALYKSALSACADAIYLSPQKNKEKKLAALSPAVTNPPDYFYLFRLKFMIDIRFLLNLPHWLRLFRDKTRLRHRHSIQGE